MALASQVPCIELNDGNRIPMLALGTGRGTAKEVCGFTFLIGILENFKALKLKGSLTGLHAFMRAWHSFSAGFTFFG